MAGISIDDLEEMWAKDAPIDRTEPSAELARIPILHAKYQRIYTHHSLMGKKLMADYKKLERFKSDYYCGDLNNADDLKKHGLEPWPKKVLRNDVAKYVQSDPDIIDLSLKIELHGQIAKTAENILSELKSRTFQLQTIVKWEIFTGGG